MIDEWQRAVPIGAAFSMGKNFREPVNTLIHK